jgi:hypothetical protein
MLPSSGTNVYATPVFDACAKPRHPLSIKNAGIGILNIGKGFPLQSVVIHSPTGIMVRNLQIIDTTRLTEATADLSNDFNPP